MEHYKYNCTLKTVTPIFIGAGSEYNYSPNEYIQRKARLKGKDTVVNIIKRIDISKYYKSLPDDKKDDFLADVSEPDFSLDDIKDKNVGKYTNYMSISNCVNKPRTIMEHVKTLNKLYIPGSSIKGALETALLYDNTTTRNIKKISIRRNKKGNYFLNNRDYNNFINNYFSADNARNKAQSNIMKYLQITDTNTINTRPYIYDTKTIEATSNHNYTYHKRHGNIVYGFYETVKPNKELQCDFITRTDDKILEKLNLTGKKELLNIEYIKEALYNFSQDYIEYEIEFTKKYNMDFLTKFYKELSKTNSIDKPLIKIGAGSGLMQTTINMKIKKEDPVLFEKIRQINRRSYPYEYPKSRKITCKTQRPLGWIQTSFKEEGK